MPWTHYIMFGAIFGGISVAMGAFGAHALKSILSPHYLQVFETAVRYQMYHAITLLCVGLLATRIDSVALKFSGYFFIAGILIFSGSLYILTLAGIKWFGAITPIGGVFLIAGWLALFWSVYKIS